MNCPVCDRPLVSRITKPGQAGKPSLYFTCPEDSRHIRGFVNDPAFVKAAQKLKDPAELLASGAKG